MAPESYLAEARAMLVADGFPPPMVEAALFGLACHAEALAMVGAPTECIRCEAFAMAMRVAEALFPRAPLPAVPAGERIH